MIRIGKYKRLKHESRFLEGLPLRLHRAALLLGPLGVNRGQAVLWALKPVK